MQLTDDQIKKYQILYYERFGVRLGRAEVCEKAESLVRMVELVYKPMTKDELTSIKKRRKEIFNNLKNNL